MALPPPLRRWWLRRRHGDGPWAALLAAPPAGERVVLDLETTGLDPASDHILSLAAVPLRGRVLRVSERFTRRIRPERGFGIDSIRHHGILPAEAAGGAPVRAAVREFLAWLGPRDLLGYRLDFDLAMLAPHVRAITGFDRVMAYRFQPDDSGVVVAEAPRWQGPGVVVHRAGMGEDRASVIFASPKEISEFVKVKCE